jgi:hypothetical protein
MFSSLEASLMSGKGDIVLFGDVDLSPMQILPVRGPTKRTDY